jgi:hypothetical protein
MYFLSSLLYVLLHVIRIQSPQKVMFWHLPLFCWSQKSISFASMTIFYTFPLGLGFTGAAIFGNSLLWWEWLHRRSSVWSRTSCANRWVHYQHEKDCRTPQGKVVVIHIWSVQVIYLRAYLVALICVQSLSEKTRVIFLSCPPLNEEMLRKSTR